MPAMDEEAIQSGYKYAEKYHYAYYLTQTPAELREARAIFREIALKQNIPQAERQARLIDDVLRIKRGMAV